MDTLFIIGNGFDMAHDMKTSYLYFKKFVYEQAYSGSENTKLLASLKSQRGIKEFLKNRDDELYKHTLYTDEVHDILENGNHQAKLQLVYQILLQVTDVELFWADFEEKLECFTFLNTSTPDFISNQGVSNEKAKEEFAKEVAGKLGLCISHELNRLIKEWIVSTYQKWLDEVKEGENISTKATVLNNRNAYFLNFNYTKTLEDYYGISENVCHIHGDIDDPIVVFGHGQDVITVPAETNELSYFLYKLSAGLKKTVSELLREKRTFFEELETVEHIYIIGFNISDEDGVDAPYFREIFSKVPNADIYVDAHDSEKEYQIKKILHAWGAQKAYDLQFINTDKDEIVKVK